MSGSLFIASNLNLRVQWTCLAIIKNKLELQVATVAHAPLMLPHGADLKKRKKSTNFLGTNFSGFRKSLSAAHQRGRERKGPLEIIQKFRLRNWPISSANFPMTPMEGTQHHFRPLWFTAEPNAEKATCGETVVQNAEICSNMFSIDFKAEKA